MACMNQSLDWCWSYHNWCWGVQGCMGLGGVRKMSIGWGTWGG
jgi:hypothetical protein